MRKFNDEDKVESGFSNDYLPFGITKVQLMLFEHGGTGDDESEYIEATVCDPKDGEITETARFWFSTDKSANISFNAIRQIVVHNAAEKDKGKARDAVDAVADCEELTALLNEKLIGGECWFTKYYDPTRTYQNKSGVTKKSVNKNLLGYEPKLKPELMPKDESQGAATDPLAGAEDVTNDPDVKVPSKW